MILFYKTDFFPFIPCLYGFTKDFKIFKFSISQSPPVTETVQQISELWGQYKKIYWNSKMHPSCLTPLVLSIFNLPCQLWGATTFDWVISPCRNFQDNLISYIPFIWKSFIRFWDRSCPKLWNFGQFDMEWPLLKFKASLLFIWHIPTLGQLSVGYHTHFPLSTLVREIAICMHCNVSLLQSCTLI